MAWGDNERGQCNVPSWLGNVRSIAAMELPAALFGRERFRSGDHIRLSSTFWSHGRGYRTEWAGEFELAD